MLNSEVHSLISAKGFYYLCLEKEKIMLNTIKHIKKELIIKCAKETKKIITIEDHNVIGGLGSAICEVLSEEHPTKIIRMGIKDVFGKSGNAEELIRCFEIDSLSIVKKIKEN